MKQCRYCFAQMRDDAMFCSSCGKPASTPTPAPYTAYPPPASAPMPTRGKPKVDPAKTHASIAMHPGKLLILVIAAILGLGLFSILLGVIVPTDMTEAYQEALDEELGDFESPIEQYIVAAYADDEELAREVFPESLREEDLSERGWEPLDDGADSYEITEVRRYHDESVLMLGIELGEQVDAALDAEVAITYDDGDEDLLEITLVRIDGEWYVYEIM